jgi:hypothetical protein
MRKPTCKNYSSCLGFAAMESAKDVPCGHCAKYQPGLAPSIYERIIELDACRSMWAECLGNRLNHRVVSTRGDNGGLNVSNGRQDYLIDRGDKWTLMKAV